MLSLRILFHSKPRLVAALIALALCVKALVPAGYMISAPHLAITIEICADASGLPSSMQLLVPRESMQDSDAKSQNFCPYASLAMPSLSGADAPLLVLAIAYILALGFAGAVWLRFRPAAHLRPPLRGPPLNA